jgi:hypothetical protein
MTAAAITTLTNRAKPADANNGDTVTVGGNLTGTSTTTLTISGGSAALQASGSSGGSGLVGGSDSGNGVSGTATTGTGVLGTSTGGSVGVEGTTTGGATFNAGVLGSNRGSGPGVLGTTTGSDAAVEGDNSNTGPGVFGNSFNGTVTLGVANVPGSPGVAGTNISGGTGVLGSSVSGAGNSNVGVFGQATGSSGGIGVLGLCSNDVNSVGVYAQSATGKGFLGFSNSVNGVGAVGVNSTSGIGLYGVSSGGYGGVFGGNVYVSGALTVIGAKSAAVRDAGGALRRMYSLESPESWFEDFGSGQLSGGSATVALDPVFASLVKSDAYHVFAMPQGDCKGLYVSAKTANGFTIRELEGGSSIVAFDYRVVCRRKDIPGARLERVDDPSLPEFPEQVAAQPIPPVPPIRRRKA